MAVGGWRSAAMPLAAGLLCFMAYLRSLWCGFVNMDDPLYVLDNPLVRGLGAAAVLRMFSEVHAGFWMPLTWLSLAVDYRLWGLDPFGYHLTNIVLHAANTGLVVLIADNVLKEVRGSVNAQPGTQTAEQGWLHPATLLLAGLLWGIHPLRVESVAWVTERKDVLNGLFAFSSVLCYMAYVRSRSENKPFLFAYVMSLVLFVCSLMAKSVTVLLPLVLLAMDRYPFDRMSKGGLPKLVSEKIPFFIVSGTVVAWTLLFAHQADILASHDTLTFLQRLLISGNAIFEYCRLLLLPTGIMPLHIIDLVDMPTYAIKSAVVAIGGGMVLIYGFNRQWSAVTVTLCFLLLLLPVLAFFQNGLQAYAARFTYLPSVAPTVLACCLWAGHCAAAGHRSRVALLLAAVAVVAGYGAMTQRQIGVWENSGTVWTRIIEISPSGRAYKERGMHRLATGNYPAALDDLTTSLEYARRADLPEIFNLHAYRGEVLRLLGRYPEAVEEFSRAIALCPSEMYFLRRALALEAQGRNGEAAEDFRRSGSAGNTMNWLEKNACERP